MFGTGVAIKPALWTAVRPLDENAKRLRKVADRIFPEAVADRMRERYLDQAAETEGKARLIRELLTHETVPPRFGNGHPDSAGRNPCGCISAIGPWVEEIGTRFFPGFLSACVRGDFRLDRLAGC